MALSQPRLKNKIKAILEDESLEETNAELSRDRFADKLATAIIDEIKEAKITYTSGLTSATGGAVSGTFGGGLS